MLVKLFRQPLLGSSITNSRECSMDRNHVLPAFLVYRACICPGSTNHAVLARSNSDPFFKSRDAAAVIMSSGMAAQR